MIYAAIYKVLTGEILNTMESDSLQSVDNFSVEGYGIVRLSSTSEAINKYISNGELREYSTEELSIKNNLPIGYIWKMPERIAIDTRTPETEWAAVRNKRNQLLITSDWTQVPDIPLATKEVWAVYRQALRDITLQPDPFNITWPIAPQ